MTFKFSISLLSFILASNTVLGVSHRDPEKDYEATDTSTVPEPTENEVGKTVGPPARIRFLFGPRDWGLTQYDLAQTGQSDLEWIGDHLDDPEEIYATYTVLKEIWCKTGCDKTGYMSYAQLTELVTPDLHGHMNAWFTENFNGDQQKIGREAFMSVMYHTLNHQQIETINSRLQ
ncbi:uncharacterized protein LOC126843993 [Adelges cooleyi]|uniref:uncharacterized protein LOC126843993 n=1 Tax=Adelges cooleyi TaxID=133065 RepID=UPI00217F3087|nr:uncharacterized protein LOC126843993 [Adelges cooleyi]